MATISGANNEKVYSITKWLGLNEHPDGDTNLRMGEASKMVNWKITRDGNLKRRPGQEFVTGLCSTYKADQSDDVAPIATYTSENDIVLVYQSISVSSAPGKIVPVGVSGVVEEGVYTAPFATVSSGVLEGSEAVPLSVSNGVLVAGSSERHTVGDLADMLAELGDDEFLYVSIDGAVYKVRNDSMEFASGAYVLNGYEVKAVPADDEVHPIMGMWAGLAGGEMNFLAACDDGIWRLYKQGNDSFTREYIGEVDTDKGVNFIPFNDKVYIQNGYEYYVYDGTSLTTVVGYVPIVAVGIGPQGSADAGELTGYYVNLLTPKRRAWLSPNGTGTVFQLPETDLKSIDSITDLSDGSEVTGWTGDIANGTVTFSSAPAVAVNGYEVEYTAKSHGDEAEGEPDIPDYRAQVTGNLFCEIFSGQTDSALFFYGDGTNRAIYTGMDYDGMPRADYFPDQYEVRIGDSNTPITAMVRHYSALLAYKTDSTWALSYGTTELATGDLTTAIYVTPVNRDKGNLAPGQVRLVENNPVTCSSSELYHWINSSYYTSQLSRDERQAKRISDRVQKSIKEIDLEHCCMWDDNDGQEFYISGNGVTLVWNYVTDTWYRYDGLKATRMCNFQGDVFIGTSEGKVLRLSDTSPTDEGYAINAEWESGAMDFGASHMRKYSSMMWVGLKPVEGSSVDVCVETDRKNTFKDKIVSSDRAKIKGQPFVVRSKIKAKKFVFYRLLLSVSEKMPAVTVTNVDFRVRQTGYTK